MEKYNSKNNNNNTHILHVNVTRQGIMEQEDMEAVMGGEAVWEFWNLYKKTFQISRET